MADDLSLLVTVDTEGDDEWSFHRRPANENIARVLDLEAALERVGVRATYLVTWSVATDPRAVAPLAELYERGRCEIGSHCHSWNTPPEAEPDGCQPFLNEFSREVQYAKLERLTDAIEESFSVRPTSFRGGRFGFGPDTARCLVDLGYRVESSVTPGISWRGTAGLPGGPGGPDYRGASLATYPMDLDDPTKPGAGELYQIPVTVARSRKLSPGLEHWLAGFGPTGLASKAANRLGLGNLLWFRPTFHSLDEIVAAADVAIARGTNVLNMMLHSSELHPGTNPYARTPAEVAALIGRMEQALEIVLAKTRAVPRTLEECRQANVSEDRFARPAARELERGLTEC